MDEELARTRSAILCWTGYLVLAILVFTEKLGQTTSDTRLDLTDAPGRFLAGTLSLWNPRVSLGELQNQAYGYLFPQGLYYAGLEAAHVPGWVAERLWSVLLLVVACEGLRRLTRAMGFDAWACALAGLCYGLTPRMIAELGVRSAEILPGAVIPWVLLPVVHAVNGRLGYRRAALLSAAAFAFSGGVNGTATAAPAALVAVFVLWAAMRGHLPWCFVLWWGGLMAAVNLWWIASLLRLGAFSPPFFDFVEDARTTTATSGFSSALRGTSNWVNYIVVGGRTWWPAGYQVSLDPWLVVAAGTLASFGVLGLVRHRGPFRTPLLVATVLGLACLCLAHTGAWAGPLAPFFQGLLDGALAPLRNVPKADPVLRVPLCVGIAAIAQEWLRAATRGSARGWRPRARRVGGGVLVGALGLSVCAMSWPVLTANLRTPGWEAIPDYWSRTARYLDDSAADGAAWIVPGSGFGIETWGWTMEEPMQVLGTSSWVTRSQVPLSPPATIRMLSKLETYLETGAGSPYLRNMLARIGIDRVVVRNDLDPEPSLATPSSLVAVALARSPGLERVATFGELDFGPAIEVYDVDRADGTRPVGEPGFRVRDTADAVTVSSSVEDVLTGVGAGLVGDDQPVVVSHESGWDRAPDIVGDGYRRRERAFGRVHEAESNVMSRDDEYRDGRVVPNYPGPPGSSPVVARYDEIAGVTASTSAGFADIIGALHPGRAPWAALDEDPATFWSPAPFTRAQGQWVDVDLGSARRLGRVTLRQPVAALGLQRVTSWRLVAGDTAVEVPVDDYTGVGSADLGGVTARHLRVEVARVEDDADLSSIGLADIDIAGLSPSRTLVLPDVGAGPRADYLFTARPESRVCVTTLLGPDCDLGRVAQSEESVGIDRTFTVPAGGSWRVSGLAVARAGPGTAELLQPVLAVRGSGSSWLDSDPTVAPRMAWDGDPTTSWVADPRDREPTLDFDLGRRRVVRSLRVARPAAIAARPTRAVVRGGGEVRTVDLTGPGDFAPLTARRLRITFSRPGGDFLAIGVGELRLRPATVTVPLDGGATTGARCGFGPGLEVDGRILRTRVRGPMGAVVSAGQLAVKPCDGRLDIPAGEHRVRLLGTGQFGPVALRLRAVEPARTVRPSRTLAEISSEDTRQVLRVSDGEDAILSVPHSFNEGWQARIGKTVLRPQQVDGWSQGWLLPAGTAGTVVVEFTPQTGYLVTLLGGLGVLALVLLAALVLAVRTRLDPPVPVRQEPVARTRRGRALMIGGALLLALAIGGWLVALAALGGTVLTRWPRLLQVIGASLLLGCYVAVATTVGDTQQRPSAVVDVLTGVGLVLLLTSVLPAPERWWRRA